jgi:hypothetical protein
VDQRPKTWCKATYKPPRLVKQCEKNKAAGLGFCRYVVADLVLFETFQAPSPCGSFHYFPIGFRFILISLPIVPRFCLRRVHNCSMSPLIHPNWRSRDLGGILISTLQSGLVPLLTSIIKYFVLLQGASVSSQALPRLAMSAKTLIRGDIGNARCSILEPICQVIDELMRKDAASDAAQGFTRVPNRSETSFINTSLRRLRCDSATLRSRPVIVAKGVIDLDENMKTRADALFYVMTTFEGNPVADLPALYKHFVRHTNSPNTPPWPLEGKDPISIRPQLQRPHQYVLAIRLTLPSGTEIQFHNTVDPEASTAKYSLEPASFRDLDMSYHELVRDLPPDLASARAAITQAKRMIEEQKSAGLRV